MCVVRRGRSVAAVAATLQARSAAAAPPSVPRTCRASAADDGKADAAGKTATKNAKSKRSAEPKPKRVSALDAAAQVLAKAGAPMRAQDLIVAMAEEGLWKSPAGKTPHSTLYAAMMREARDKGATARFKKVDRGQFAYNG